MGISINAEKPVLTPKNLAGQHTGYADCLLLAQTVLVPESSVHVILNTDHPPNILQAPDLQNGKIKHPNLHLLHLRTWFLAERQP